MTAYRLQETNTKAGSGKIWCARRRTSWPARRLLAGIRSRCAGGEVSTAWAFKAGRLSKKKKKSCQGREKSIKKKHRSDCLLLVVSRQKNKTPSRFPQVHSADDVLLPGAMTRFEGDPARMSRRCIPGQVFTVPAESWSGWNEECQCFRFPSFSRISKRMLLSIFI